MTGRKLRSRSCSVDNRAGSVQGNLEDSNLTEFSQEGEIMATKIQESEILTSDPNRENTNDDNAIINPSSNDQTNNISQDQLKDILNIVMQAILTLPSFTDSSKQVPLHFISDLDLYFRLKQSPDHLKLPLTYRAVQEPIAKQWLSSTWDKLSNYVEFRKWFTDLLWNPNRQAGIRSQIYLDKHTQNSGESYVDHYIRYANLASSLDPPMTDMDLLSALTSRYEPRVQQGLVCGKFKCTQDVLATCRKYKG
jgi:hypothetical protein